MTAAHLTHVVTVPATRQAPQVELQLRPLRLRLRPATPPGQVQQLVDGAWWPYSDDLITELSPLLFGMAEHGHPVHRISYCLDAWQPVPRKQHIAGTLIRLGGYRTQSPAVIHLIDSSGKAPLVLVVVPPTTAPAAAQKALDLAVAKVALDGPAILDLIAP